jgi:hypothetical protein
VNKENVMRTMVIAGVLGVVCAGATAQQKAAVEGAAHEQAADLAPHEQVNGARLMETLRSLPTARSVMGDEAHWQGLLETERLLHEGLTALGHEVRVHEFEWTLPERMRRMVLRASEIDDSPEATEAAGAEGRHLHRNLYVDIVGHVLPREVFVVGAHFDAVPGSPGADDNGTGVAAVMELARVLRETPMKRTVRLMLFTAEEAGCVGSSKYVADWRDKQSALPEEERERIVGMVSLEMLGYFSDEPGSQKSPIQPIKGVFEPPTVGNSIVIVGIAPHKALTEGFEAGMLLGAPAMPVTRVDFSPVPLLDFMRSDHRGFLLAGIPAFMLTDTANFRNPHYHKATDTADTIDVSRFTLVVRGVARAVQRMADE